MTAGAAFSPAPVVYEEDRYGNVEAGDSTTKVTAALASGSGPLRGTAQVTVSQGVATFADLADNKAGTIALKFTGGGLASATSGAITVNPAAASKLVIATQPSAKATAGAPFAVQPVVYEEDQFGNVETGDSTTVVTAALASGSGPLQGTTQVAVAQGVAAFTNLFDDKAETIKLSLTSGSLAQATSSSVAVSPAAASELVIATQPSATATAGVAFATQPVVYEEDQFGNVETTDSTTKVTATLASGSGPLQGTTQVTVSKGVAKFTNLSDRKAETITLAFTGGGLAQATSSSITVSPAAASKLVIASQPTTATAGSAFSPAPVVDEVDAYGNLETGDSSTTVSVALASGCRTAAGDHPGDRLRRASPTSATSSTTRPGRSS